MKFAYIDHYDSFTANLIDWLTDAPENVDVIFAAYDDATQMEKIAQQRLPLVISPGPKTPADAESTLTLLRASLGKVPIFGVCLGHQMLGAMLGANIISAAQPQHGSTRLIKMNPANRLFHNAPATFKVGVYNSLVIDSHAIPPSLNVVGRCDDDEVQVIEFVPDVGQPAIGVQFHPESFLSDDLNWLRRTWWEIVRSYAAANTTI